MLEWKYCAELFIRKQFYGECAMHDKQVILLAVVLLATVHRTNWEVKWKTFSVFFFLLLKRKAHWKWIMGSFDFWVHDLFKLVTMFATGCPRGRHTSSNLWHICGKVWDLVWCRHHCVWKYICNGSSRHFLVSDGSCGQDTKTLRKTYTRLNELWKYSDSLTYRVCIGLHWRTYWSSPG